MKIKTISQLSAIVFIILVGVFGGLTLLVSQEMIEVHEKEGVTDRILKDVFELNLLTNDFLLYREERAQEQWQMKYNSLGTALQETERFENPTEKSLLASILREYEDLNDIFTQLIRSDISEELEIRLVSQLSIKSQIISSKSAQLMDLLYTAAVATQQKSTLLTVLFFISVTAVVVTNIFISTRMISKPLTKIIQRTEEFAKGNFEAKSGITSKDEMGELSRALTHMAEELTMARELKKTEQLRTDFINVAAHELKTPLIPIIGYADMLRKNKKLSKDMKSKLEIILKNALKQKKLVDDFLDIARLESETMKLDFKSTDMNEVVNTAISDMKKSAEKKGLKLEVVLAKDLPKVEADGFRILQVLENLLKNAIHFTEKGKITVKTDIADNEVVVSVKDTGVGIAKENMRKLFTKFFQADTGLKRKVAGTGLGLSIAKGIVDAHQGRIWAESELGKGSTFYFRLPLERKVTAEKLVKATD